MDARATAARVHHQESQKSAALARQHREERDRIVRQLYEEGGWSYTSLARAVGVTPPLIAKIIRPQDR